MVPAPARRGLQAARAAAAEGASSAEEEGEEGEEAEVGEEAALSLGAGRLRTFWRVILPAVRPALVAGLGAALKGATLTDAAIDAEVASWPQELRDAISVTPALDRSFQVASMIVRIPA